MEEWSCAEITKINAFKSETESVSKAKPEVAMFGGDLLILKHASASRPSGERSDDDFDVLCRWRRRWPHLQSECGAGRRALDVDVRFRASEGTPTHGNEEPTHGRG
jgi:hypothetical protein